MRKLIVFYNGYSLETSRKKYCLMFQDDFDTVNSNIAFSSQNIGAKYYAKLVFTRCKCTNGKNLKGRKSRYCLLTHKTC